MAQLRDASPAKGQAVHGTTPNGPSCCNAKIPKAPGAKKSWGEAVRGTIATRLPRGRGH